MNLRKVVFSSLLAFSVAGISEAPAKDEIETISDFLAWCAKESDCHSIVADQLIVATLVDKTACGPDLPTETDGAAVVRWLKAHPETHNMKNWDGKLRAFQALYPCRR